MYNGNKTHKLDCQCSFCKAGRGELTVDNNPNFKHGKCCIQQYCTNCNAKISSRGKTGLCMTCCKIGKSNPFYNKKHNVVTRQTMKEKAKLRDKSSYYKIPMTTELIKRISITKKRNWNKLTIEEKHKKLKNWIKAGKKKKGTKIEKIIRTLLDNIGMLENIDYKTNVYINAFNVDILVNQKFIIECYGDYWHKNPKYYNAEEDIEKRKSDLKRKNFLEKKGYKFISFWETEIYKELETVEKKLETFFGSYINLFEWESCSH